ncbi:MAG: Fe-S cluster assembly protein SufD [Bacteroidales bacterium]|nr:Fe-S cluster assembly protein SufD [Bacteroidales bacterium]
MSIDAQSIDLKDRYLDYFYKNLEYLKDGLPAYINDKREKAIQTFQKKGIPHNKNEAYKYTDLNSAFEKQYKNYMHPKKIDFNLDDIFKCDVPELNTHVVLLLNGWFYENKTPRRQLPNGVIISSFREAANKYPSLIKKHYNQYADSESESLTALNTAFAQDGVFLYVPEGKVMDKPVQIINLLLDEEDGMAQHRNLFVIEESGEAKVIVCDHTLSEKNFLTNSVTEMYVGQNANLDFDRVQNEHNGSTQISNIYLHQEKDSNVLSNTITLHGGLVRNNFYMQLKGENCENQTLGLYLGDRSQHIDNYVHIDHAFPNCRSNQLFKGVLDDMATGAFSGRILVRQDAQKTEAYQANNNILLTDDAKMNSKPQLEIYADDVKCSHGGTSGQPNENALFYLRSRGIPYKEAQLLLMYAFAHEIIGQIRTPPLQDRIHELVEKRLRGELSRCNYCEIDCGDPGKN